MRMKRRKGRSWEGMILISRYLGILTGSLFEERGVYCVLLSSCV